MVAEVLAHVGKKPATVLYPFEKVEMPDQFRGKIVFISSNCTGCKLCMKDCPAAAISINKVGEKRFEAVFDLDHCIYCAQCVDSCRRGALQTSKTFELAALSRAPLRIVYDAPPAPEPSAPSGTPAAPDKSGQGAK
jgi:formate hydrogenlyase subunit 6/NADH:ubiquinone oxidoreductase subunit I